MNARNWATTYVVAWELQLASKVNQHHFRLFGLGPPTCCTYHTLNLPLAAVFWPT